MPAIVIYGIYTNADLAGNFRRNLREQLAAVAGKPSEEIGVYLVTERSPESGQLIYAEIKGILDPETATLANTVICRAIKDLQLASEDTNPIKRAAVEVVTDIPSNPSRVSALPN